MIAQVSGLDGKNRMRFSPMAATALSLRRCGPVPPFVSARSMAIRVSRKLGIPLKSGLAARVAAHVQYAPSFIQQVDAVFHFLAGTFSRHSELSGGSSSPVSK